MHGVWDRDNPIGAHIYGHTNLTEMKLAFDLFWRNDVPAGKLNMGIGFYGRAFQLQDPGCSKPGCNFAGGATKGGCSGESGILSYREIMAIIDNKKIKPVHDKKAGVKYITWNNDQWVSFDDADTISQKKDLAKDLGLGGYLIWAIDQDDESLSALQAVIAPKKLGDLGAAGGGDDWQSSNKHCYVTSCKGNCDTGDIKVTEMRCGSDGDDRQKLCCPLSGAPDPRECSWRGTAPLCNGHCHDDEVMMMMNRWGDGSYCNDGNKAYCCKSPLAQENSCYWAGVAASCNSGDLPLTFSGTVLSILDDVAKVILRVLGRAYPLATLVGEALLLVLDELDLDTDKRYCCPSGDIDKWKNCNWFGKPGSCFDGHCPDMTYVQLTDSYFGGGETCGIQLSRVRTFCCEPTDDPLFLPVPLKNLFQHPPEGDSVDTDFSLETDKESDAQQNPSDAAFQFVVLASPEELQVSLDKRDGSHWDVYGCLDGETEGEHTVQMVCTDFSENSNCHKIRLGHGVPGTILQMPVGCGPGKYAVAKEMVPAESTRVLPRRLAHLKATHTPVIYNLTFDYDFARVPRDLGDTQMRIDFSNQDDYWDTVVAGSVAKKRKRGVKRSLADVGGSHVRWLEEEFRDDYHFGGLSKREVDKRWFGTDILAWLAQLVKPEIKREFTHKYDDTLTAKLIDESWSCSKGDVNYEGHLLAQALLKVKIESSFGFTLIVTKLSLPLDLSQSYLTFYNKGEITGVLTLEAVAKVFYEKSDVIINLPFPGASFKIPGIATIGPQLTVEGSIDASLALAGKIESRLEFAKWEVRQVVPDNNDDQYKPKEIADGDPDLDQNGDMEGVEEPAFYAGLQASGDVTARISAAAEFGVRFDKRWEVDPAAVAVVGEASVMVKMAAGASTQGVCPFTWGLDVGARLFARAKAPAIFRWPGAEYDITPKYNKPIVEGGTCPELGPIPTRKKRDLSAAGDLLSLASDNVSLSSSPPSPGPAVPLLHGRSSSNSLAKRAAVWGPVLSVPVGSYFCPSSTDESENSGSPCGQIQPMPDPDPGWNTDDDDYPWPQRRWLEPSEESSLSLDTNNSTTAAELESELELDPPMSVLVKRAPKSTQICDMGVTIQYPRAGEVPNNPAYGFVRPDVCEDFEFGAPLERRVSTNPATPYHSEHVLEFQLLKWFFLDLDRDLPSVPHPDPSRQGQLSFCELVREQWRDVPVFAIAGLDTGKGFEARLKPADHVAQQFPTTTFHADEYVVLEGKINIPAKGKAWGRVPATPYKEMEIVDTSEWMDKLGNEDDVHSMLKSIRYLIGSRMYHNDFYIREILRRQKDRVADVLEQLDTVYLPARPRSPAPYRPWVPLGLKAKWNEFMTGQFFVVQTKTMKVINEFLPRIQEQWANDARRQEARITGGESDADRRRKEQLQVLIDKIDATDDVLRALPAWQRPF